MLARKKLLEEGKSEADIDRKIKARRKLNTKGYQNVRVEGIVWNGEDPAEMFEHNLEGLRQRRQTVWSFRLLSISKSTTTCHFASLGRRF